jgi:hypothetical protein
MVAILLFFFRSLTGFVAVFLVRGFAKVRGEWSLMALCYNLRPNHQPISRYGMRSRPSLPATPPSATMAEKLGRQVSSLACCLMATAIG